MDGWVGGKRGDRTSRDSKALVPPHVNSTDGRMGRWIDGRVATGFWWETMARKGAAGIGTTCSGNSMYVQLGAARDGRDPYMTYGASRGTLILR